MSVTGPTARELVSAYEAILLDAYGILVDAQGALPGARELIAHLHAIGKPFFVVTNDASRSVIATAQRYRSLGLEVPDDRVITSGSLLGACLSELGLVGAGCVVLGPPDSEAYVREAGGLILPLFGAKPSEVAALIVGDESGFPFLEGCDAALSLAIRKIDAGEPLRLILPNPDLIYPKREGDFGFAAGTIAQIIESALALRYPGRGDLGFLRLGKPHRAIFVEAVARAGTRKVLMIGDQLETDVRGAKAMGLDSVLVLSGVARPPHQLPEQLRPTYVVASLI
jgi:HAD superfamily hydrolase (TIGR01450 family)